MGLYKRGKTYWYRFDFQGKPYERSTHSKNREVAAQIEVKVKNDLALGLVGLQPMQPGTAFKEYAKQFLEFVENHSASPATTVSYRSSIARLLKYEPLAKCRLNFISEALIEDYIKFRKKAVTIATLNNELIALRRALNVARKKLKVMTTVVNISLLPGAHERTFVLSYTQEAAYLAACNDTMRDAAILMLDTGLRDGECVLVKWTDIVDDSARLKTWNRTVYLSARCQEMLANRRLFREKGEAYVFPGRRNPHIGVWSLDQYHRDARRRARLEDGSELPAEFVIHSLRHTFATRFGEIAENAFLVKEALGHADIRMSQKYVHPRTDSTARAFAQLDNLNQLMRQGRDKIRDTTKTRPVKH